MIGNSLGPYRVLEKLGAGGMGEVFLAEDTRLVRKVAIKVLPGEFASDPERLARFEQEARAAAALNHPHIAAVFDVGVERSPNAVNAAPAVHYIVQEYLEGESLREPLRKGPLPLNRALELAAEIAEALAAAHAAGIIHRDLKPENVFITKEGHAKVLDFGLAKLTELAGGRASQLSMSPTLLGTVAGQVMGTAGYMAPEQAEGSTDIDQRADTFAFGCVLYEMTTGRQPFAGRSIAETLSHIQHDEPKSISEIDRALPAELQRILRKCLAKEPTRRYQSAGDLGVDLRALAGSVDAGRATPVATETAAPLFGKAGLAIAIAGATLAGLAIGYLLFGRTPASRTPRLSELSITLPEDQAVNITNWPGRGLAISPRGDTIVFAGGGDEPLYVRSAEGRVLRLLEGTEQARNPFFSPDGEWVSFFTQSQLKKVRVDGSGAPITLANEIRNSAWALGTWGDDDNIVFAPWDGGLQRIEASAPDGAVEVLTAPEDESHQAPQVLPGSETVLYYAHTAEGNEIRRRSLTSAGDATEATILENASHPLYLRSGHLLFVRDGGLLVVPFDIDTYKVGAPASVPVRTGFDAPTMSDAVPQLAVSHGGTLLHALPLGRDAEESELVWVRRDGSVELLDTLPYPLPSIQLSPDDSRLALEYRDGANVRIALYDMQGRSNYVLLSKTQEFTGMPVWVPPDGDEIVSSHPRANNSSMFSVNVEGAAEELEIFRNAISFMFPFSFSADGSLLAYGTGSGISVYEFGNQSQEGRIVPVVDDPLALPYAPDLSPDGRWIAYSARQGGMREVWVRRYPSGTGMTQVSHNGGRGPIWASGGSEIFFQTLDGSEVWVASFETEPEVRIGDPVLIARGIYKRSGDGGRSYDVSTDGQRVLLVRLQQREGHFTEFVVRFDWFEELERLAPTR